MKKPLPYYLSRAASFALHPFVVPVYIVALLLTVSMTAVYSPAMKAFVFRTVVYMTCLMPIAFVVILKVFGVLKNYSLATRSERVLPLLAVILCYAGCGWIFADVDMLFVVRKALFASASCVAIAFVVNMWWQISLHMTAVGGALGIMWSLLYMGDTSLLHPFCIGILLAGCLASARLYLEKHTPAQVLAGFLMGFVAASALFIVF